MSAFNWLDFILIFMLLLAMAIGYAQGLIRQLIGLAAVYVGLVIATQFFVPLTQAYSSLTLTSPNTLTNAISFFVILLLTMFVLNILGQDAYRQLRFNMFPLLNHVGGMLLGVASMWILLTVVVNVLLFAINTQSWGNADPYRLILDNGLTNSRVAEVTASTLPIIVSTIRPWLPSGLPALFEL
jgi:uncharacterized membrane protein required for colicin V production